MSRKLIITPEQKKDLRKDVRALRKENRLKTAAIYAEVAAKYGISPNYCANLCRV